MSLATSSPIGPARRHRPRCAACLTQRSRSPTARLIGRRTPASSVPPRPLPGSPQVDRRRLVPLLVADASFVGQPCDVPVRTPRQQGVVHRQREPSGLRSCIKRRHLKRPAIRTGGGPFPISPSLSRRHRSGPAPRSTPPRPGGRPPAVLRLIGSGSRMAPAFLLGGLPCLLLK